MTGNVGHTTIGVLNQVAVVVTVLIGGEFPTTVSVVVGTSHGHEVDHLGADSSTWIAQLSDLASR
ncbi:hypothetical protein D3C85_1750630 [compost metagenome]